MECAALTLGPELDDVKQVHEFALGDGAAEQRVQHRCVAET
jgi:hypothetical protein